MDSACAKDRSLHSKPCFPLSVDNCADMFFHPFIIAAKARMERWRIAAQPAYGAQSTNAELSNRAKGAVAAAPDGRAIAPGCAILA